MECAHWNLHAKIWNKQITASKDIDQIASLRFTVCVSCLPTLYRIIQYTCNNRTLRNRKHKEKGELEKEREIEKKKEIDKTLISI